jgi:hypothetical protein
MYILLSLIIMLMKVDACLSVEAWYDEQYSWLNSSISVRDYWRTFRYNSY